MHQFQGHFIVLDPWNGGDPNWYFFVILNRYSRNKVFYWKSFWFIWMAFISRFVNAKNLENLHPLFCGFKFNFDPRHLRVVHCLFWQKCLPKWHPWSTWWVMERRLCRCFQYLPPNRKDEKNFWIDHFFRSTSRSWQCGGGICGPTFPADPFLVQVLQLFFCLAEVFRLGPWTWNLLKPFRPWLEELVFQCFPICRSEATCWQQPALKCTFAGTMGVVGKKKQAPVVETHLQQNTNSPGLRVEGAKQLWREALVLFEVACSEFFAKQRSFFSCVGVSNPRKIEGIFLGVSKFETILNLSEFSDTLQLYLRLWPWGSLSWT